MDSILIIEDDEQTFELMHNVLRHLEHQIIHAGTAKNGLELAKQYSPKLILLDMRLPGMTGWELAPILKQDPSLRNIPIIAVSVQVDADDPMAGTHEHLGVDARAATELEDGVVADVARHPGQPDVEPGV